MEPVHEYVVTYPRLTRSLRMREAPQFAEKCVRVVSEGRFRALQLRVQRKLGIGTPVERSIGSFDVYHATNYVFTHAVKRARRVVTIHDMTLVLFPEWHPRARVNSMTHEIARSLEIADHILADSAATRDDIVKHFSLRAERINVVPLAADRSFRPLPAEEIQTVLSNWNLAQHGYLLFLGNARAAKESAAALAGSRAGRQPDRPARHRRRRRLGKMKSPAASSGCRAPGG